MVLAHFRLAGFLQSLCPIVIWSLTFLLFSWRPPIITKHFVYLMAPVTVSFPNHNYPFFRMALDMRMVCFHSSSLGSEDIRSQYHARNDATDRWSRKWWRIIWEVVHNFHCWTGHPLAPDEGTQGCRCHSRCFAIMTNHGPAILSNYPWSFSKVIQATSSCGLSWGLSIRFVNIVVCPDRLMELDKHRTAQYRDRPSRLQCLCSTRCPINLISSALNSHPSIRHISLYSLHIRVHI